MWIKDFKQKKWRDLKPEIGYEVGEMSRKMKCQKQSCCRIFLLDSIYCNKSSVQWSSEYINKNPFTYSHISHHDPEAE